MTQEEKSLLLRDLCTRLTYGVSLKIGEYSDYTLQGIVLSNVNKPLLVRCNGTDFECSIEHVKPYLRPMSSMTEDEKLDYIALGDIKRYTNPQYAYLISEQLDYLNAHHFDYRGLIEMGLALEVKGVDLEKEVKYILNQYYYFPEESIDIPTVIRITAKHFFELGIKARKDNKYDTRR